MVFAGKPGKIMTNIGQYNLSRGRDAEICIDNTRSKMAYPVTPLNLRILSSDVRLEFGKYSFRNEAAKPIIINEVRRGIYCLAEECMSYLFIQ